MAFSAVAVVVTITVALLGVAVFHLIGGQPCEETETIELAEFGNISIPICSVYSETYHEARSKFRVGVKQLSGSRLDSLVVIDGKEDGDTYTIDVAVIPGTVPGLTIHSSGVHGIEGFAGSAIQVAVLQALLEQERQKDTTDRPSLVLIHAFNPYGMAMYRRANENNVDLNRNGLTKAEWNTFATNHYNRANYDKFDSLFNPTSEPTIFNSYITFVPRMLKDVLTHGIPTLKAAMVSGQYHNKAGIFYGGSDQVETSYRVLDTWLRQYLQEQDFSGQSVTWLDVHTGLGKSGEDTILAGSHTTVSSYAGGDLAAEVDRWYPTSNNPLSKAGSDGSAEGKKVAQGYEKVLGLLGDFYRPRVGQLCSSALLIVQEFGTLPSVVMGHALMVENQAYHYLPSVEAKVDWAKWTLRPAFYPRSKTWRRSILERGTRALWRSMERSKHLC